MFCTGDSIKTVTITGICSFRTLFWEGGGGGGTITKDRVSVGIDFLLEINYLSHKMFNNFKLLVGVSLSGGCVCCESYIDVALPSVP